MQVLLLQAVPSLGNPVKKKSWKTSHWVALVFQKISGHGRRIL
jgi:hypothetical protein